MADKGNDLVYAGKVGHGFDKKSSADLRKRLTPLIRKTQPYTKRIAQKGIWVEPELLAEIEYRAKSAQGPRACGRIYDKSTSPTETRLSVYGTLTKGRNFLLGQNKETHMSSKTIALVAAFVLSSSMALAQSGQGKAGSDNGPTSNAPTTSGSMNQDVAGTKMKKSKTTKMKKPVPTKDASTQGAGTAGAAQKKGDATTPGGTMKQ